MTYLPHTLKIIAGTDTEERGRRHDVTRRRWTGRTGDACAHVTHQALPERRLPRTVLRDGWWLES